MMAESFQRQQQEWQAAYLRRAEFEGKVGDHDRTFQFLPDHSHWNLAPAIADEAKALFDHEDRAQKIQWHRYAGHGCSSQACCVNFLLPLANYPDLLATWIDHVAGVSGAEPVAIEERHGIPRLIAFEWFPPETDYLNEASGGVRPRGANSTSVDAAITFRLGNQLRLLLIEWKYIESYGSNRNDEHKKGDPTRLQRYHNIWKRPHGPLRSDIEIDNLSDLFLDPWYQLLRQQMLAYHAETDPLSNYDHVTLLHISPSKNTSLKTIRGAPFLEYARKRGISGELFDAFKDMIASEWRGRFIPLSTEEAFRPIADAPHMAWLKDRYPDLFDPKDPA